MMRLLQRKHGRFRWQRSLSVTIDGRRSKLLGPPRRLLMVWFIIIVVLGSVGRPRCWRSSMLRFIASLAVLKFDKFRVIHHHLLSATNFLWLPINWHLIEIVEGASLIFSIALQMIICLHYIILWPFFRIFIAQTTTIVLIDDHLFYGEVIVLLFCLKVVWTYGTIIVASGQQFDLADLRRFQKLCIVGRIFVSGSLQIEDVIDYDVVDQHIALLVLSRGAYNLLPLPDNLNVLYGLLGNRMVNLVLFRF